jgi:hypothetical protein
MKPISKKTCMLAALPLILSLSIIPTAYARAARPDWPGAGDMHHGSFLLIPLRNPGVRLDMRASEREFVSPPAMAYSQNQANDPFADLHFE